MKKFFTLLSLILCIAVSSLSVTAQTKFKITEPHVNFFAGTPLEDIDANSEKLVGVLDIEKNTFAFRIAMNSFKFKRELMQEHYNENYLETDKYPNAEFRGTIEGDFDITHDGEYTVTTKGNFNIHAIVKEYTIDAIISVQDGIVSIKATFPIQLKDHDIKRPKIVLMKIADKVDVSVEAKLTAL